MSIHIDRAVSEVEIIPEPKHARSEATPRAPEHLARARVRDLLERIQRDRARLCAWGYDD